MTTTHDKQTYEKGMTKSRNTLWGKIKSVFSGKQALGEAEIEDIEDILIASDVGVDSTMRIIADLRKDPAMAGGISEEELKQFLASHISEELAAYPTADPLAVEGAASPHVILVTGVNGTGKTTTIGKLSARAVREGRKVMLVAADTYRAAAAEQLTIWAERSGARIVKGPEGGDPAAVVHDGLTSARSSGIDLVLIDTAGRLHTKEPLMKELEKIRRVAEKVIEGSPHRVLLVLDATTGQNALAQARTFRESAGVTDLVITKMDGSARGGFLLPVTAQLQTPVSYVGLGEGMDDLVPFDPEEYARNLVGL
jgi:fused signal recognition particle receptor